MYLSVVNGRELRRGQFVHLSRTRHLVDPEELERKGILSQLIPSLNSPSGVHYRSFAFLLFRPVPAELTSEGVAGS